MRQMHWNTNKSRDTQLASSSQASTCDHRSIPFSVVLTMGRYCESNIILRYVFWHCLQVPCGGRLKNVEQSTPRTCHCFFKLLSVASRVARYSKQTPAFLSSLQSNRTIWVALLSGSLAKMSENESEEMEKKPCREPRTEVLMPFHLDYAVDTSLVIYTTS
jgi:hypothetical protein